MAAVRANFSALCETDAQVEKIDKKFEDVEKTRARYRETQAKQRLELGRSLVELRKQWPARGPNSRGWGEFLKKEGIDERAARRYMELAGYVEKISDSDDVESENIPTQREVSAARAAERTEGEGDRPARIRLVDPETQPDPVVLDVADAGPSSGRGKPEWLMQALVRHYSRLHNLVCDPFAGWCSTLRSARTEGRRAVGSEMDPGIAKQANDSDLRIGSWQESLADVGQVDAIITDPPYSARTHAAATTRSDGSSAAGLTPTYAAWTPENVHEFVSAWSPRCRGWMVALTDSELIPAYTEAYRAAGRYAFAPLPIVIKGMSVRISGDGPSSWTVYAMVARPSTREFVAWGTLPGAYVGTKSRELWVDETPAVPHG